MSYMHPSDTKVYQSWTAVKIENIVCSGSFNQPLDLKRLASECSYVEYGKNRYPGAYLKFDSHSITIYRTGKYIMPGMRSFEDVDKTFSRMKIILAPFTDVSLFSEPEVRNMVHSSNVGRELNLGRMLTELLSEDMDVVYEPEAFPGLILKAEGCTFNVFSSGKFLILGCTDEKQATRCESSFLEICGRPGFN